MSKKYRSRSTGFKRGFFISKEPTTTVNHQIIFTATEKIKLKEIIIDLSIIVVGTTALQHNWEALFHIFRNGQQICDSPVATGRDQGRLPEEYLFSIGGVADFRTNVGTSNGENRFRRFKVKRILKKDDEINFSSQSTDAGGVVSITGPITMIFEQI